MHQSVFSEVCGRLVCVLFRFLFNNMQMTLFGQKDGQKVGKA